MASSEQHQDLARRCGPWLNGRTTGRGVRSGFEVPLAEGYVADWFALCGFQNRFVEAYVEAGQFEYNGGFRVRPEFACVFEVKVSRPDFLSTFGANGNGKRNSPIGSLHWLVMPGGRASLGRGSVESLPVFWGVLVASGNGLHEVRRPKYCAVALGDLYGLAYHLLWYGKDRPG